MSYRVFNHLLDGQSQAVGASATDTAVSGNFTLSAEDSRNLLVKVVVSGHSGTVTADLQDSFDGGTTWEDAGTVSVSGDGNFEIEHDASEATTGCLWPLCRVVITTSTTSGATVDAVYVTHRN